MPCSTWPRWTATTPSTCARGSGSAETRAARARRSRGPQPPSWGPDLKRWLTMIGSCTTAATKAAFSYCWLWGYVKKAVKAASKHCQTSLTGLAEVPDAGGPGPQGLRPLHGGGQQEGQDSPHLANKDWHRLLFWKKTFFFQSNLENILSS